jgi:hypothetical protein
VQLPVGGATITVTPTSTNAAPDGSGSVGSSGSASVTVAGLPKTGAISVEGEAQTAITVSNAPLDRNGSNRGNEVLYVAVPAGADFSCSVGQDGTGLRASGGATSTSRTITGLDENRQYTVGACVSNGFGAAKTGTANGWAWNQAGAPVPQSPVYEIPSGQGNGNGTYLVRRAPDVDPPRGFEAVFLGHQNPSTQWQQPGIGAEGSMQVKYCVQGSDQSRCGAPVRIAAADPARAKQVQLSDARLTACVVGSRLQASVNQNPGGLGTLAIKTADPAPRFYSEGILGGVFASELDPDPNDPLKVPNGTSRATANLVFTFTDGGAQYGTIEVDATYRGCTGSVAPQPTTTPTTPPAN